MNTALLIPRGCAQRTCRSIATRRQPFPQPPSQQQQLPIRSLSSTASHSYATPTETPQTKARTNTRSKPQSKHETLSARTQGPLENSPTTTNSTTNPSHNPEDQTQPSPSQLYIGTVTRTGTMRSTVQITRHHQVYDPFIQKHYTRPLRLKAHDPNPPTYLREGDVVEYGVWTQQEKDNKQSQEVARTARKEEKLKKSDKTGRLLGKFRRDEATRVLLKGRKMRGVQFVVRRVVTPFGVGLDERMGRLAKGKGSGQEKSARGGQDSLLVGLGGSLSRGSGRASVAG